MTLRIGANGTRRARWDARLGFLRRPQPPLLPLSSLRPAGGPAACVDVVVTRVYPLQVSAHQGLPDAGQCCVPAPAGLFLATKSTGVDSRGCASAQHSSEISTVAVWDGDCVVRIVWFWRGTNGLLYNQKIT